MRSLPTVKKRATCTTQAHDQPQCNQLMTPNKELAVTIHHNASAFDNDRLNSAFTVGMGTEVHASWPEQFQWQQ